MARRDRCRHLQRPEELNEPRCSSCFARTCPLIRFGLPLCKIDFFTRRKNSSVECGLLSRRIGRLPLFPCRPISFPLATIGTDLWRFFWESAFSGEALFFFWGQVNYRSLGVGHL